MSAVLKAASITGKIGAGGIVVGAKDAVLYTEQALTEEQQEQARVNIGAADVVVVNELKGDLTNVLDKVPTKNLFDKNTISDNILINGTTGVEEVSDRYFTSDYIHVPTGGWTISAISKKTSEYAFRIAVYNTDKSYNSRLLSTELVYTSRIAGWIRVTFEKSREFDINSIQIELGTSQTDYVPHFMPYDYNARALIDANKAEIELLKTKPITTHIYEADDKVASGHIVNAVAYEDGTIIACRSDGRVVRITPVGEETTLLTLTGTMFDWRCCYMDSRETVFVSPHTSKGNMNYSDRGLYKLDKGASSFIKVLSLSTNGEFDDCIWTMCEDKRGFLYAGVYAHTMHSNPKIYKSINNGASWVDRYTFGEGKHIHSIVYSNFNSSLYAIVGETNNIYKSTDEAVTFTPTNVILGVKGSAMLPLDDGGILVGSDGSYNCDIDFVHSDDVKHDKVFRGWANTVFAIRKSDKTGYIYAFTKIDSSAVSLSYYPSASVLNKNKYDMWDDIISWKNGLSKTNKKAWEVYHDSVADVYSSDAIIPTHYGILRSIDNGKTWEVLKRWEVQKVDNAYGFWTIGYFRNGECLAGRLTENGYDNPIVLSENEHEYTCSGLDTTGDIFRATNASRIAKVVN